MRRREFLQIAGLSGASAVAFAGCYIPEKETRIESPTRIPEDLVTGRDNYYATDCSGCSGGCGIIVRVMEGRAKKVEGNPDHPVSVGKSCVTGQALVQSLYHPDRFAGPRKLTGAKGSNSFSAARWDDVIKEAADRIKASTSGRLVLMTGRLSGSEALVASKLVDSLGGSRLSLEPLEDTVYRAVARQVFGTDALPNYDIANAKTVLSIGADWLGSWGSPVMQSTQYGNFRQGRTATRGYLIHADSRFSQTAANADEWVPIRPGTEGLFALAIAASLAQQNLGARAAFPAGGAAAYNAFRPEAVAQAIGVKAERITAIAKRLGGEGPALVIGGGSAGAHTNGVFNLTHILSLNYLLGNVGNAGGVRFNPAPVLRDIPFQAGGSPFTDWERELIRLRGIGANATILVYGANPAYALPTAMGVRDILSKAKVFVLSGMPDDTTAFADLILPSSNPLENWGFDVPPTQPGYAVVSFRQPVVNRHPEYDVQPFDSTLMKIAQTIGGDVARAVPWSTGRDVVREAGRQLFERRQGSVTAADFDSFWNGVLQRGGWWSISMPGIGSGRAAAVPSSMEQPKFAGEERSYPFHLQLFPSNSIGAGEGANLPWLQQTPDPITTVTWGTWVEINRKVAKQLGLAEGDIVAVESPNGRIEAPVYINFGTPDWTVAMPAGNGHTGSGQYAAKAVGPNPLAILAPLTEPQTGGLAWAATRVSIMKTGRKETLHKWEGYVTPVQTEHGVIEVAKS